MNNVDFPSLSCTSTAQKTPLKPSLSAIEMDDGICDPELRAFIQTEFKRNVIRDYPVIDFISRVWDTTPSQIPHGDYALTQERCLKYLGAGRYSKRSKLRRLGEDGPPLIELAGRGETRACAAFQELFETTASLVRDQWNQQDPTAAQEIERTRFQGTLRFLNEKIVQGNYANIKPDFGYVTENGENTDAIAWDAFGLFGELKKVDDAVNKAERVIIDRSMLDVSCGLDFLFFYRYSTSSSKRRRNCIPPFAKAGNARSRILQSKRGHHQNFESIIPIPC